MLSQVTIQLKILQARKDGNFPGGAAIMSDMHQTQRMCLTQVLEIGNSPAMFNDKTRSNMELDGSNCIRLIIINLYCAFYPFTQ